MADDNGYLDPAVEYARKPNSESSKTESSFSTTEIVFFFVMWAAFTGIIIFFALDSGWNIWLAVLAGVVGGFIIAIISTIFAAAGFTF